MDLAVSVYGLTKTFPREEMYGLSSQLRRAVISIPSNISEGHQQGTKSYAHFVSLALGSLAEAETQIELASRLHYATPKILKPSPRSQRVFGGCFTAFGGPWWPVPPRSLARCGPSTTCR